MVELLCLSDALFGHDSGKLRQNKPCARHFFIPHIFRIRETTKHGCVKRVHIVYRAFGIALYCTIFPMQAKKKHTVVVPSRGI